MECPKPGKQTATVVTGNIRNKKDREGTCDLGPYTMIYSGIPRERRAAAGVAILIHESWNSSIISHTCITERIATCRLKIQRVN